MRGGVVAVNLIKISSQKPVGKNFLPAGFGVCCSKLNYITTHFNEDFF
jgi:hypothetical protein